MAGRPDHSALLEAAENAGCGASNHSHAPALRWNRLFRIRKNGSSIGPLLPGVLGQVPESKPKVLFYFVRIMVSEDSGTL